LTFFSPHKQDRFYSDAKNAIKPCGLRQTLAAWSGGLSRPLMAQAAIPSPRFYVANS
jgi:hypothetical protein